MLPRKFPCNHPILDLHSATVFEKEHEFDGNLLPKVRVAFSTIMAKIPPEISETIWRLKRQLADVIDTARSTEFFLFDTFGETKRTIVYLDDLQSVAEQATERFSQFSSLQIRIFNVQPHVPGDMLELVMQSIATTQARLPALEQSIREIRTEWELP